MGVHSFYIISFVLCLLPHVFMFPDQGQWTKSEEETTIVIFGMHKTLYAGSSVSLAVNCEASDGKQKPSIEIGWVLRQTSCFEEYFSSEILNKETLRSLYDCPMNSNGNARVRYLKSEPTSVECSSPIHLKFSNSSFVTDADGMKNPLFARCQEPDPSDMVSAKSSNIDSSLLSLDGEKPSEDALNRAKTSAIDSKQTNKYESDSQFSQNKLPGHAIKVKKRASGANSDASIKQNSTVIKTALPDSVKSTDVETSSILVTVTEASIRLTAPLNDIHSKPGSKLAVVPIDGVYLFILKIESITEVLINVTVDVSMKGDYGYLSAVDYPLLLFYGYMCGIYAVYAFSWLVVSALQWRDLLRIQFWIGGVIFLGLVEKAVFYAEYQSINYTGQSVQGAVIFAEILSCLKRTLARMLVIIVSLGFGIVKPRLGPMLHRVVGVGALYFVLGAAEGCLRVLKVMSLSMTPKNDPSNQALMAGIPLAVTDSAICWWIFSSLVQTNRTLRLRRNLVKLSLYRHFTNTLIFAVLASVAYMVWSIHSHKLVTCITDWKELWVDEAYWHLLFSLLLLVIMILWRPTNNNQRYAYTPLLDAMDDDNEDDFDQNITNDAFGMKMRASKNPVPQNEKIVDEKQDDDLKWVEENVPSTFTETAVPTFLDSDEEIMTAKFERSKME